MPKLSKRGTELPTSPIRKLVVYSDQAKSKGIEVLHLNIGQPDIKAPKEAINAVQNSNLNLLPYGPLRVRPLIERNFLNIIEKMKLMLVQMKS